MVSCQCTILLQRKLQPLIHPRKSFFLLTLSYSIPGYYGDFACQSQSGSTGCRVFYMGMTTDGDFSYDYSTPSSVLNAVKVPDNTNKKTLKTKLISNLKANTTRAPLVRHLQADIGTS